MDTVSATATPNVSQGDAAALVALALQRTKNKAGEPRTRARMSYKTFRRLTGRRIGGAKFVREFTAEMVNLGWLMVRMPSAYGFVRAASLDKWPLTKSDVLAQELKLIGEGSITEVLDSARRELGKATDDSSASSAPNGSTRKKGEKTGPIGMN
ncbi:MULTISPECIES: hypothetical protein [unclassified Mesorhizobium]|uniref:hypothetical protein n=1 Tax=unclassified Mesorhizobium TaxID=325217 RepID=UPI0003CF6ADD|nr:MULTISPECIES: hypothetical protein [unclassified Mesorhizobium]ESX11379.1 hypothetical protein X766_31770 [Mesorhizobium sp. LSJC255A00]ESY17207.1 hypothetical protein X749_30820 [Mesorhizobium sp. LNJC391B00]ESY37907.1 hypothetical protein X747_25300 [Mesorhizobium sp. LNJC384A00]